VSRPLDYRPAEYRPIPAWRRAWPLVRQEAGAVFGTRWGRVLYALCLVPLLVRSVILLIIDGVLQFGPPVLRNRLASGPPTGSGPMAGLDPRRVDFYAGVALDGPAMLFVLLLSSMVVARSIARDRMTNALELYWTRGITPRAYLLAKWLGGALVVGSITVLAPVVLWLLAILLAEDWTLLTATAPQFAATLAGLVLVTCLWTAIGTFVSAAAPSANVATVVWTVAMMGTLAVAEMLAAVLQREWLRSCLSLWGAGDTVVRAVGGLPQQRVSVAGAVLLLAGMVIWTGWRARSRLRLEEAIA
jgi:hypothetical protein